MNRWREAFESAQPWQTWVPKTFEVQMKLTAKYSRPGRYLFWSVRENRLTEEWCDCHCTFRDAIEPGTICYAVRRGPKPRKYRRKLKPQA